MCGWQESRIADVVAPLTTTSPTKRPDGAFEYIDVSSISRSSYSIERTSTILGRDAPSRARRLVRAGDVLFATIRPTLQRVAVVPRHLDGAVCSTGFFVLRPRSEVHGRFLFHYLFSRRFTDEMASLQRGASYPAVSDRDVKEHVLLLPPLSEQERIAAILDKAFVAIATATTNAEKCVANARELSRSFLEAAFESVEVGTRTPLAELCHTDKVITYGVIKLGNEHPGGVPCLRTSNVRRLRIDMEGIKRIDPTLSARYGRTVLRGGEVLVNVRGTLGGVAVVPDSMSGWNVSREVAVVPADHDLVDSGFLAYCIATRASQTWLTGVLKGVAYSGINLKDLRTLPIAVPPREKQLGLVRHLEEGQLLTDALKSRSSERLALFTELKQSILHKAFTGELTADFNAADVALSKGEV
jgi:type I restriction enzyme S subunit